MRYCKSTIFQANHNSACRRIVGVTLFAILQKYDFSSKSQLKVVMDKCTTCCLRYCKSTIFQANHNPKRRDKSTARVVCDTAKVRFFKQITTKAAPFAKVYLLFAILQKYDFSSKSQRLLTLASLATCCLRYCKSTIFQANHNRLRARPACCPVVCDTAKVRFFKQITTNLGVFLVNEELFAILQKYDFSSKSQQGTLSPFMSDGCLRYCKSTIFQANHNRFQAHLL